MPEKRLLPPEARVAGASEEAYALALDALHDTQLQNALFRRINQPPVATPVPEYVTPRFEFISVDPGDRDNDMLAVPRWVLGVLAEELTARSSCGGENDEPGCPFCDAIRVAVQAFGHDLSTSMSETKDCDAGAKSEEPGS